MKLKTKQKEDLARAALCDGLIFSWDTGLGKTIGSLFWCLLKVGYTVDEGRIAPILPVLIAGPPDGFDHWKSEARNLRIDLQPLDSQDKFYRLSSNGLSLPPAFYYSSYTQLTRNGIAVADPIAEEFTEGLGEYQNGFHCIHTPTLADLAANSFACVVVDEAVRIKSAHSLIGTGIRQFNPKYRLVATATPIKNRLPDIFWLAWWATGGKPFPHARFPFAGTTADQGDFAESFLLVERSLTKEATAEAQGKRRKYQRFTAQISNVHGLWKLFAPIVLRRRKKDMSEDIPEKVRHVIRVPLGREQKAVYEYHLRADYRTEDGKLNYGAKLQALRIAAANPCSLLLKQVEDNPGKHFRSGQSFIPKLAAALRLIEQILRRNEQAIVFSAFNSSLDSLAERLSAANARHLVLDGRVRPGHRGRLATQFKSGDVPILLAGVDSMAEMHSFSSCSNCILLAYSWAWDKFEQAINRIHRINSPKPVNVYSIICDRTIDRRLEELLHEKGDSAELVIDGQLRQEAQIEINLADLLEIATTEFDPATHSLDEAALESEWPGLRVSLQSAAADWRVEPNTLVEKPD